MSVTFSIRGVELDLDDYDSYMNLANTNARELLRRLELDYEDLWGDMRATELAKKCEEALNSGEEDLGLPPRLEARNMIFGGRPPGRIDERLRQLKKLCDRAGELGVIEWN